jgi:hypothetical protein
MDTRGKNEKMPTNPGVPNRAITVNQAEGLFKKQEKGVIVENGQG